MFQLSDSLEVFNLPLTTDQSGEITELKCRVSPFLGVISRNVPASCVVFADFTEMKNVNNKTATIIILAVCSLHGNEQRGLEKLMKMVCVTAFDF